MRIAHLLVSGLLVTAVPVQLVIADDDGERAALARITHELQALDPLITEAVRIPVKTATDSDSNPPAIPLQNRHPFQLKPAT